MNILWHRLDLFALYLETAQRWRNVTALLKSENNSRGRQRQIMWAEREKRTKRTTKLRQNVYKECQCNLSVTWISFQRCIIWLRVICIFVTRERGQGESFWKGYFHFSQTNSSCPLWHLCVSVCLRKEAAFPCVLLYVWFSQTVWTTVTCLASAFAF